MAVVQMASRFIACGFAVTAFVLTVVGLVLDRDRRRRARFRVWLVWLYPFLFAAISAPAAVGALIVARRPRNPIGWILVVGALSLAAVLAATPYAWVALDAHPGSLPGGSWAALVSSLWPVFFAWPLAVAFVFPDGRLPSRRWRPYAIFAAGSMTLLRAVAGAGGAAREPFSDVANPVPLRLPEVSRLSEAAAWLAIVREPLRRRSGGPGVATGAPRGSSGCRCSGWLTRRF